MVRCLRLAALALCLGGLGACTTTGGAFQEIAVNTAPPGAECELMRQGQSIARISRTPATATIKISEHDLIIECMLAGHHKAIYHNKSGIPKVAVGSIALGGGIAWTIGSLTGADNRYPSPVDIALTPLSEPEPAPQYSHQEAARN